MNSEDTSLLMVMRRSSECLSYKRETIQLRSKDQDTKIKVPYSNIRGFNFSPYAVQMKCIRPDQYARTITLHYLMDGNVYLRIILKKKELQMPVIIILRALSEMSDYQIY
jgi:DNA-directed RNA polymerase I subunit RPA2